MTKSNNPKSKYWFCKCYNIQQLLKELRMYDECWSVGNYNYVFCKPRPVTQKYVKRLKSLVVVYPWRYNPRILSCFYKVHPTKFRIFSESHK